MDATQFRRRYAPFVVVACVQLFLVVAVPSRPASTSLDAGAAYGSTSDDFGTAGGAPITNDDANFDAGVATGEGIGSTTDASGSADAGGGTERPAGGPGAQAGASPTGPASQPSGGGQRQVPAGDLSNCGPDGRQIGPTFYMPPCQPVWPAGADNGGKTMAGVSATEIRFMVHVATLNEQVDAILATQGLAASPEDICRSFEAFTASLNKRWEFYGRTLVGVDGPGTHKGSAEQDCDFPYYKSRCNISPPDVPCFRAEANEILSMDVAFVLSDASPLEFHVELAKKGVLVTGANVPKASVLAAARNMYPYFMDGTGAAAHISEYWCKRLAGRPVAHAGLDVQDPDLNPTTPPPIRKLAVLYPASGFGSDVGVEMRDMLNGPVCKADVSYYKYTLDFNTLQQQAFTAAAAMRQDGVTTVVCVCDPVSPVFFTSAMDQQQYQPEHLTAGIMNTDYDLTGRLYSQNQWRHAFGPSSQPTAEPLADSEASKAWRDGGGSGTVPDPTSNGKWPQFSIMGTAFHLAGPQPTPDSIRAGLFGWSGAGGFAGGRGDQRYPLWRFGTTAADFSAISDIREVYWDPSRSSEVDGKPGSYHPVLDGRRYVLGSWPTSDPKVFS